MSTSNYPIEQCACKRISFEGALFVVVNGIHHRKNGPCYQEDELTRLREENTELLKKVDRYSKQILIDGLLFLAVILVSLGGVLYLSFLSAKIG